jgi:hypothetical protein
MSLIHTCELAGANPFDYRIVPAVMARPSTPLDHGAKAK